MKNKLILPLFIIVLLIVGCAEEKKENLTIYYSTSLNGNIDDCGCKAYPRVGLIKRAAYLSTLNRDSQSLLLEGGNILSKAPDSLLAEAILESYKEMGYDAIAVGLHEILAGAEAISTYKEKYNLFSNNFSVKKEDGQRQLFDTTPRILNKGNIRVGIFSVIDDTYMSLFTTEQRARIGIMSTDATVNGMTTFLETEKVDISIMLYHGTYMNLRQILKRYPTIDVVLLSSEMELVDADRIEGSVIVSPGVEGNSLGILQLSLNKKKGTVELVSNRFELFTSDSPDHEGVKARAEQYDKALAARLKENN